MRELNVSTATLLGVCQVSWGQRFHQLRVLSGAACHHWWATKRHPLVKPLSSQAFSADAVEVMAEAGSVSQ